MKIRTKFIGVMSIAVGLCLMTSSVQAGWGGRGGGGWGWGGRGWGWGFPVGLSFYYSAPYYSYPYNYYSAPPVYYSPAPTVVYSAPPTVSASQQPAQPPDDAQRPLADRPLPPTAAVRDADSELPPSQRPAPARQNAPSQSAGLADVKALVKAQIGDPIIISQIRNSRVVFHLTSDQIIDLKNSGVSEKVIDFMINTPSANQ